MQPFEGGKSLTGGHKPASSGKQAANRCRLEYFTTAFLSALPSRKRSRNECGALRSGANRSAAAVRTRTFVRDQAPGSERVELDKKRKLLRGVEGRGH